MSREQERLDMYYFGTLKWQPTPNAIYQTALQNLATWRERPAIKNMRAAARRDGASARHQGTVKGVAFLPAHLQGANSASDVIRAAIKGILDGRKSREVATLYIYQNEDALRDALSIAEATERNAQTDTHPH